MEKKIVIKIGSGVLLTKRQKFDEFRLNHLAEQVKKLQEKGYSVVLVVSGAVAAGSKVIDLSDNDAHKRQAAAGIGQIQLITALTETFQKHELQLAQVLVTKDLLELYEQNIKNLLDFYTKNGIIAVINENDVLDLNSFGGNDILAGEIAKLIQTEEVVILSTMKGSVYGVGGGETKVIVKKMLEAINIETIIVNGKTKNILLTL